MRNRKRKVSKKKLQQPELLPLILCDTYLSCHGSELILFFVVFVIVSIMVVAEQKKGYISIALTNRSR